MSGNCRRRNRIRRVDKATALLCCKQPQEWGAELQVSASSVQAVWAVPHRKASLRGKSFITNFQTPAFDVRTKRGCLTSFSPTWQKENPPTPTLPLQRRALLKTVWLGWEGAVEINVIFSRWSYTDLKLQSWYRSRRHQLTWFISWFSYLKSASKPIRLQGVRNTAATAECSAAAGFGGPGTAPAEPYSHCHPGLGAHKGWDEGFKTSCSCGTLFWALQRNSQLFA